MGQRRSVRVYKLVSEGGIEEHKFMRQVYKKQLTDQTLDGTSSARVFDGMSGGKTAGDHGKIFGLENLFRFDDVGHYRTIREEAQKARERRRAGMDASARAKVSECFFYLPLHFVRILLTI